MRKIPTIDLQFYTINLTILPPAENTSEYYSGLIVKIFKAQNVLKFGSFFYRMTRLDLIKTSEGNAFFGVISKYISLDDVEWVEENDTPVNYSVPDNVNGRTASYEFVFYPKTHRFAFIKRGRIEQNSSRGPAPLKAIVHYVKNAVDLMLDIENKFCTVNIVQSDQIFDEIFSSNVKSLDLTVSYSNPGLDDDHDETMDEYLRKAHAGKTRVVMSPDSTGVIDTDAIFTRGLLNLAKENGKVKAKVETSEGTKLINTESHPDVNQITIEKSGNIELKFITNIMKQLRKNIPNE
jgi:hypothetical protein